MRNGTIVNTRQRRAVLQLLHDHGPIVDKSGLASTRLAELLGWTRTATLSNLRGMADDGLIVRDIRGKRTFRIALPDDGRPSTNGDAHVEPEPPVEVVPPAEVVEPVEPSDEPAAEAVAAALLRLFLERVADRDVDVIRERYDTELGIVRDRLASALDESQRLRAKVRALQDEIVACRDETVGLRRAKSALQLQLDQVQAAAARQGQVILNQVTRDALDRLMREPPRS